LLATAVLTLALQSVSQSWSNALEDAETTIQQVQAQTTVQIQTQQQTRHQASQFQTINDIAQACASVLDPDTLLQTVVAQIEAGFKPMGVYHVGLFLLDETGRQAELKAATGEAGQLAMEIGYTLDVNSATPIGWSIVHQQARIVSEEERREITHFDALALPHSRSEIVLPLRSRGNILGALNIHSSQETAFVPADAAVLQTMADQIAVAIDNAHLFHQTQTVLAEVQEVQRRYVRQAWRELLSQRPVNEIIYTQPGTDLADDRFLLEARRQALTQGETVRTGPPNELNGQREKEKEMDDVSTTPPATPSEPSTLVVPLKLRGQVIGTIALCDPQRQRQWTAEEIAMAETIAEQVALTVENLRLLEETQRRAAHDRLVGEVTARVRATLDIETVLKTAAQEVRQALGLPEVVVRLASQPAHHPEHPLLDETGNGSGPHTARDDREQQPEHVAASPNTGEDGGNDV
jgi:GAF domain-containing protein